MASKKLKRGPAVLIRAYGAGVHFGYLKRRAGKEVELDGARRIWRWFGANTLSEIALRGLDVAKSRVAERVDGHVLTDVIEVLPCSKEATANLESARWNP